MIIRLLAERGKERLRQERNVEENEYLFAYL